GGQWLAAGRATFVKVVVQGLWHLGTVTAACVAAAGLETVGLDTDPEVVAELGAGRPPLLEPGLAELVADGLAAGRLRFTRDPAAAHRAALALLSEPALYVVRVRRDVETRDQCLPGDLRDVRQ